MPLLLQSLGIAVHLKIRRASCPVHGGSNPTAFAWRRDGRWHCFACGAGGDRIALVRAVRKCSFREAATLLAALAGVEYRSHRVPRRKIAQTRHRRAEAAAWRIADEIGRLRRYYTDTLHRAERLQTRIGDDISRSSTEVVREFEWEQLVQLAPVCTFFFSAWNFIWDAKPGLLVRFALASTMERRRLILEGVEP